MSEYAFYLSEALTEWGWIENDGLLDDKITLIGHSMGAAVSLIYSAAFPEHINRIVLLEGAGPLPRQNSDISRHIRLAIKKRGSFNRKFYDCFQENEDSASVGNNDRKDNYYKIRISGNGRKLVYATLENAIKARMKTAKNYPGEQYISYEAAESLVLRAIMPANETFSYVNASRNSFLSKAFTGPVVYMHDQRLASPSMQYFSHDQVDALYKDIKCPVILLTADNGWPGDSLIQKSVMSILKPVIKKQLPGSHHFHADPTSAQKVIDEVVAFLETH